MRSILMKNLAAAIWVCSAVAMVFALSGGSVILAQERTNTPVKVTRIYTGPDGVTHAEETTVTMKRGGGSTDLSPSVNISSVQLRRTPPTYFRDWHSPTERLYIVTLFGRQNIELSDGTTVRTYPGHVLLVEDLTGKGHTERGIGIEDHVAALMTVAPPK